jgi:hypothetical protein
MRRAHRMKLLATLTAISIFLCSMCVAANADLAPYYQCLLGKTAVGSSADVTVPLGKTPVDYKGAARAEVTIVEVEVACDKKFGDPGGVRQHATDQAFGYAMAANYYRCARDTLLASELERKTRVALKAIEPPRTDKEAQEFRNDLAIAAPAPNSKC